MIDLLYLLLTVVFFWLMIAYLKGCERLGEESGEESRK